MLGRSKLVVAFAVLVLVLSVSGFAFAGTTQEWELLYENDAQGQAVSGSWSALATAIESGASVKVVYHYASNTSFNTSMVATVAMADRSRSICYIHWTGNSMGDDDGDGIATLRDNYLDSEILRTDGKKEYLLRNGNGTVYAHGFETVAMKWYVNK